MSWQSWMVLALAFAPLLLPAAGDLPLRALGAGAALLAATAACGGRLRPLSNGTLALLLAWLGLVCVQVASVEDPLGGVERALPLLAALALFAVAHTAVPRAERERLLAALGLAGVGVACAALYLAEPGSPAHAPLGAPEQLAGWLLLPAIVGLAGLWLCAPHGRSALWNIAWFTVVGLCMAAIAATRSGAAFVAVALAATLLFALARFGRRVVVASVALAGVALASLVPALDLAPASDFARAGFGSAPWLAPFTEIGVARVPALLLSAAVALRRIRPLRGGKGSLTAWGGAGAVFCIAGWSLIDTRDPAPAILLGVALLAGLAWPAGGSAGTATTRVTLSTLAAGLVVALCVAA